MGTLANAMKSSLPLKLLITLGAILAIILHALKPDLRIDGVTLGLLIVALLPWLSAIIESAEFPGGWKIKFRDVQAAGQKVSRITATPHANRVALQPSSSLLSEGDPNLALVSLRIEIERRLRALAERHEISNWRSLSQLVRMLRERGVVDDQASSGLDELIRAGNNAAHGARVERSAAAWAIDHGPEVLAALDGIL